MKIMINDEGKIVYPQIWVMLNLGFMLCFVYNMLFYTILQFISPAGEKFIRIFRGNIGHSGVCHNEKSNNENVKSLAIYMYYSFNGMCR